jgi:hypothetical protein
MKRRKGNHPGSGYYLISTAFLGMKRFTLPLTRDFPFSPLIGLSQKDFNGKGLSRRGYNALPFRQKRQGHR